MSPPTSLTDTDPVSPRRRIDPARRVRDILRRQVLSGAFGQDPLPSEHALACQFAVSRNVVRDALDLLRHEGLVERIPGAGTFVISKKSSQGLDRLRGLAETFSNADAPIVNRVLAAEIVGAPPFVAERLQLAPGDPVVFIERLRRLGPEPLSLDASYLDASVAAGLLDADLVRNDVFLLLEERLGLALASASLSIEAVAADDATAVFLGIAPGSPLILLDRLSYLDDGRPVDLEFVRYRGDRLSLTTYLTRQSQED